jgi:hypothetical protein
MKLGFELPNVVNVSPEAWAQVDALGGQVVKVRPYHLTPPVIQDIASRRLTVLLRPDSDEGPVFDTPARAKHLADAAWTLRLAGVQDIRIIPDNEPNHPNHGPSDERSRAMYWRRISDVVMRLYKGKGCQALADTVQYLTPPLAVGHDEAAWYAAATEAQPLGEGMLDQPVGEPGSLIKDFDGVCIHAYGQLDDSLVRHAVALVSGYGVPVVADEIGDSHASASAFQKSVSVAAYCRILAEAGVELGTIFIAPEPTDEWKGFVLPTDRLGAIRDAVAIVVPQPEPEPTPEPQPVVVSPWQGRGAWVWEMSQCGGVEGVITLARKYRLDWVAIKIADGRHVWRGRVFQRDFDLIGAAGINAVAWVYAYGYDTAEADRHVQAAIDLRCDGIIIDAEAEMRDSGNAIAYAQAAKAKASESGLPLAFAPLPIRKYHSGLAYDEWARLGYTLMPQAYTNDLGPKFPIEDILTDWRTAYPNAEIVPAYGMYGETGYSGDQGATYPTADDVADFVAACDATSCSGRSYWRLDTIRESVLEAGDPGDDTMKPDDRAAILKELDLVWAVAAAMKANSQYDPAHRLEAAVRAIKDILAA